MSVKPKNAHELGNRDVPVGASLLAAVLLAALGLLFGIIHLALIPPIEVRTMPNEDKIQAKAVYYVRGNASSTAAYRPKEEVLRAGRPGVYRLQESELNSWARDTFSFSKSKDEKENNYFQVNPSLPNFRIEKSTFQMSMLVEFKIYNRDSRKIRFQAKGTFVDDSGTWRFKPERAFLGTAELPNVLIAPALTSAFIKLFEKQEDFPAFEKAWLALDTVSVEGDSLVLQKNK